METAVLTNLISEYRHLAEQEKQLAERKAGLRKQILAEMARNKLRRFGNADGVAQITTRFKLIPKLELVLALVKVEDLLPFLQFTSAKVRDLLVPKYGREPLLPLFEVEKNESLLVTRGNQANPAVHEASADYEVPVDTEAGVVTDGEAGNTDLTSGNDEKLDN